VPEAVRQVVRSEAWRLMLEKVRAAGKGWKWPDYNQVRGPMLDKAEWVVADLVRAWDAWDPHACACAARVRQYWRTCPSDPSPSSHTNQPPPPVLDTCRCARAGSTRQ
jgi:hypothetical protein